MSERDERVCNGVSSSLSPRNPRVMSSWSVRSTISGGKRFSNRNEEKQLEQQLTLVSIFTIHGDEKDASSSREVVVRAQVSNSSTGMSWGKSEENVRRVSY